MGDVCLFFFFKQKTAYEMRISDWSSDVCSSDLLAFDALASAGHDISLKTMLEPVTQALGNTPAIARQSYVHPRLVDLAKEGQATFRAGLRLPRKTRYLSRAERGLIAFLTGESADRKRVVSGTSVSARVAPGCRRIIKKKKQKIRHRITVYK